MKEQGIALTVIFILTICFTVSGVCFAYFKEEVTPWDESTPQWNAGYHIMGGAEFLQRDMLSLAAEVKWSSIPDVIGNHGVSAYYEESNIGGLSIIFKVNFHLK